MSGAEESCVRALAKLEQVLPARPRRRVNAPHSYTAPLPGGGPVADAGVLSALATACRDHEGLRFDYVMHDGREAVRNVQPHRLAHARGR